MGLGAVAVCRPATIAEVHCSAFMSSRRDTGTVAAPSPANSERTSSRWTSATEIGKKV
jgi:hypothetical protein